MKNDCRLICAAGANQRVFIKIFEAPLPQTVFDKIMSYIIHLTLMTGKIFAITPTN